MTRLVEFKAGDIAAGMKVLEVSPMTTEHIKTKKNPDGYYRRRQYIKSKCLRCGKIKTMSRESLVDRVRLGRTKCTSCKDVKEVTKKPIVSACVGKSDNFYRLYLNMMPDTTYADIGFPMELHNLFMGAKCDQKTHL